MGYLCRDCKHWKTSEAMFPNKAAGKGDGYCCCFPTASYTHGSEESCGQFILRTQRPNLKE